MAKCSIYNGIEYVMSKEMAYDIMKTRAKSADKLKKVHIDTAYIRDYINDQYNLITNCVKVTVR